RAKLLRPCVAALLAVLAPVGESVIVESTPHGAHVVIMLDRATSAEEAAQAAKVLAAVARRHAPRGIGVEAFPRVEAGKARHCSLPLLGSARRRKADLTTADGSKRAGIEALIAAPGVSLDRLRALIEGVS